MSLANVINAAFNYVINTSNKFGIDESHSLKHSMDVFHLANKIYDSELHANDFLRNHKQIISVSAIIHDMCDKKYMNEQNAIQDMHVFMKDYMKETEIEVVSKIISTMSYSKVKQNGFPDLKEYQLAYHIVREADLLSAYDIDRCIIYGMMKEKNTYDDSVTRALQLCDSRILKYRSDNLFVTDYSKIHSERLHNKCLEDIKSISNML